MTGSLLVDLVLLVLFVAYGVSGWRQGAVAALIGLGGLALGAFVAVRFGPGLLESYADVDTATSTGTLALLGLIVLAATLGQFGTLALAAPARDAVRASQYRVLDSVFGAMSVLVVMALVVSTVAGTVTVGGPPTLRTSVGESRVVRVLGAVMPSSASVLTASVLDALDRGGFPRVFVAPGPEPIEAVDTPDNQLVDDPQIQAAYESVIHISASAPRCDQTQVGSGWVAAPGVIVTNAHVVAGSSRVRVRTQGAGQERDARVVAFDPRRDVAVLTVIGLEAPALTQGSDLAKGDGAVVAGYPGDEGLYAGAIRIRQILQAPGADIYGEPGSTRRIYSMRARVRQGASGGPVVDPDGKVVGMVFATSLDDPDTGYALTLQELAPALTAGERRERVGTGPCVDH